jgi:hypothetical protein
MVRLQFIPPASNIANTRRSSRVDLAMAALNEAVLQQMQE